MGIFGNRMGIGTSGSNSRLYYAKGTCYEPDTFPTLPPRVLLRLPFLFILFFFYYELLLHFLFRSFSPYHVLSFVFLFLHRSPL